MQVETMIARIKERILEGRPLTKIQKQFISEMLVSGYDADCGLCAYNLAACLDLPSPLLDKAVD